MRLDSITLHGFKSFGERTELRILPGVSCIVGPNGCGKSNISDAVRWALGEQSAKLLRGQRMDDVIFYGSASRKPVGLAEVELRFSNDGVLAVPWSEIAVARRLYRTGESEYLLNKQPTRLRDILDLFAGTGANPRAYSVMDQDKLNHVLTAKPHERRVFIEEAAGIARYKQQRSETQGKLDGARGNLVRVKDVMDEVKRQLGSLERQAKRAQQYKALEQERRDGALVLAAADFAGLVAEADRLELEIAQHHEREEVLRTTVSRLAGHQATQREAIQVSDHRLSDLRQGVQKVQADLERLLERREQMGVQLREAAEEVVRLDEEIRVTGERLDVLAAERETTRGALGEAERLVAERTQAADHLAGLVERRRSGLAEERDRLEGLRLEQIRIAAERTDLMRSAGELRERESQLARRGERLATELREAETEAERIVAARAGCGGGAGRAPGLGRGRALRPGPRRRHVSPRTRRRRRDVLAPRVPVVSLRPFPRGRRCALDRSSRYGASREPRPLPARPGCDRRSSGSGGDPLAAERCQRDVRHAERRGAGADGATTPRCGGRRGAALAAGRQTAAAGAGRADPRTDRDGGDHADHGRPDRS